MYRNLLVCGLAVLSTSAVAMANTLDVNQPVRTNNLYFDNGTGAARPGVGQSFIPSLPILTRIDVNLVGPVAGLVPDINQTTFTLSVYNAGGSAGGEGPTGSALVSKSVDYNNLLDQGDPNSFDTFEFASPLAVTPGQKYFFQVTLQDFTTSSVRAFNAGQSVNASYPGGVGLVLESDVWQLHDGSDARDLQFRTYGAVPEPATLGALAAAAGCLLARRRR